MIQDKSALVRELSLIFVLLCFLLIIFGGTFLPFSPVAAAIFLAGLLWSGTRSNASPRAERIVTGVGVACILAWLINALMHSYFDRKEITLIFMKVEGFLIALFCFCSATRRYRTYIIFMSAPIALEAVLFSPRAPVRAGIFLVGVFFCWLALLKARFGDSFQFVESSYRQKGGFLFIPAVSCAVVALCSCLVFFALHAPYLKSTGFFDSSGLIDTSDLQSLEKEYFVRQADFQEQAVKKAPSLSVSDDRHAMLKLVSFMARDTSEVVEVEKAHQGLRSLLRLPGPGDERGEGEGVTHTLNAYAEIKSTVNIIRESDKMVRKALEKDAQIFKAVAMVFSLGTLRLASTEEAITAAGARLDADVNALGVTGARQSDLLNRSKDLKQWQVYKSFLQQTRLLKGQLESAPLSVRGDFLNAVSHIEDIQTAEDVRESMQEVSRTKQQYPARKNYSRKLKEILDLRRDMYVGQITDDILTRISDAGVSEEAMRQIQESLEGLTAAPTLNPQSRLGEHVIASESEKLTALVREAAAETGISKEEQQKLIDEARALSKVLLAEAKQEQAKAQESLKQEEEKKQQAKDPAKFRAALSAFLAALLALLCILCGFLAYRFFMTARARRRLASELHDPRSFIIKLYANMERVIALFGMRQKEQSPPLLRAYLMAKAFGIRVDELVAFCERFEKARYSRHTISSQDALGALQSYNLFLDVLFKHSKAMVRLEKVCLSVMGAVPLKIRCA